MKKIYWLIILLNSYLGGFYFEQRANEKYYCVKKFAI